jgi:hypothetical protein
MNFMTPKKRQRAFNRRPWLDGQSRFKRALACGQFFDRKFFDSSSQRPLTKSIRWDDLELQSEWSRSQDQQLWAANERTITWCRLIDAPVRARWNNLDCNGHCADATLVPELGATYHGTLGLSFC